MQVQAITRYVRVSPQKANEVARLIRGMRASEALDTLKFIPRKPARLIRKTLQSAIANAENNASLDVHDLVVKSAEVGSGPLIKRWMAVARGSAHPIIKRTSHIKVILSDDEAAKRSKSKPKDKAARPKQGTQQPEKTEPSETEGEKK